MAADRYHVSEGTLRCLSALPLRIREDERARAKARVKSKNRKRRREGSVEAGLMEADARVDDDVRAKCQAEALHEVRQRSMYLVVDFTGLMCCDVYVVALSRSAIRLPIRQHHPPGAVDSGDIFVSQLYNGGCLGCTLRFHQHMYCTISIMVPPCSR